MAEKMEKLKIEKISEEAGICKLIRKVCSDAKKKRQQGVQEVDVAALFDVYIKEHFEQSLKADLWTRPQHSTVFRDASEQIDAFLLEIEVREHLKRLLEEVQMAHDEFVQSFKPDTWFPNKKSARSYLDKYSELLQQLFLLARAFEDFGEPGNRFLLDILNVDITFEKETMYASLCCPAAVDAILHIYDCIEKYVITNIQADKEKDKGLLESNYQAVIISRALRKFRWILSNGSELFQAAVPAALPLYETENDSDKERRIWSLDIPVRRLRDYNSYEGIGELRLFDKIIYELDQRKDSVKDEFCILIVGDILKKPLEVLCKTVEYWLTSQKNAENVPRIHITILTRNKWEKENKFQEHNIKITGHIRYSWKLYDNQLIHGRMLDELIDQNDWMFILDSCDLYNGIYAEGRDVSEVRRQAANGNYTVAEQQQMLYALAMTGCFGTFTKESNHTFIKYLGERLKNAASKMKTAYVYVSDLDSIDGLAFCDEHFIRMEHYNDKDFLIVRMPGRKELSLPEQVARRIIVLNLWQVIKHCTVRNIDCFMKYFKLKDIPMAINTFRNTLIGIEYGQWNEQLNFYYYLPENFNIPDRQSYESSLEKWIKVGIMPYFKAQPGNMFYDYFVKAFSSFLYSDAKSVDDMLFLHLFVNKHDVFEKVAFMGEDKKLPLYQSKACKYSQKQFYAEVMEDYDTSSEMFMYKYRKLDLMERADVDLRKTIFQKVKDACERNGYGNSYLKINCEKMI